MKIAITGHRPNKLGNDYNLTSPLIINISIELNRIIDNYKSRYWINPTTNDYARDLTLISGMALGIDTLWAKLAHQNELPLIAAIPCLNQNKMWKQLSKDLYKGLLEHPLTTQHLVTNTEYNHNCMQLRNEWMVNNCDVLIAVWDRTPGGTGNCVNYAVNQGKTIIFIDPNDYK